mgnify:CR=1 FL=1
MLSHDKGMFDYGKSLSSDANNAWWLLENEHVYYKNVEVF